MASTIFYANKAFRKQIEEAVDYGIKQAKKLLNTTEGKAVRATATHIVGTEVYDHAKKYLFDKTKDSNGKGQTLQMTDSKNAHTIPNDYHQCHCNHSTFDDVIAEWNRFIEQSNKRLR